MGVHQTRSEGTKRVTSATDFTGKEGYGVTMTGGVATLSASATVPISAIILEGGTVAQGSVVAILGSFEGAAPVKLSGTVTEGDSIQQAADGTFVVDAAAGARSICGVADTAGISGDKISAFLQTPVSRGTIAS
jgi:hypothetical protein